MMAMLKLPKDVLTPSRYRLIPMPQVKFLVEFLGAHYCPDKD
jgi:hypothetical protein